MLNRNMNLNTDTPQTLLNMNKSYDIMDDSIQSWVINNFKWQFLRRKIHHISMLVKCTDHDS